MTEYKFDSRKAKVSLLHFWALPNDEKLKCLPKKTLQVKYFISDSSSYTTHPLKYLAIESTYALDVTLTDKSGRLSGVAQELAFLLTQMLEHQTEAFFWSLGRPDYATYEDYWWFVLNRLAKEALTFWGEDKVVGLPNFEHMLICGRARRNYKKALNRK